MFINHSHELAIEAIKKNDLAKALDLLNIGLTENPYHPNILSDRGFVYVQLKNKDMALDDFDACVEFQPAYNFRYTARAYALNLFGDPVTAAEDYKKAIVLEPNDLIAHNNLALIYERMGEQALSDRHFFIADALNNSSETEIYERVEGHSQPIERVEICPSVLLRKQEDALSEMKKLFASKTDFENFINFLKKGEGPQ